MERKRSDYIPNLINKANGRFVGAHEKREDGLKIYRKPRALIKGIVIDTFHHMYSRIFMLKDGGKLDDANVLEIDQVLETTELEIAFLTGDVKRRNEILNRVPGVGK